MKKPNKSQPQASWLTASFTHLTTQGKHCRDQSQPATVSCLTTNYFSIRANEQQDTHQKLTRFLESSYESQTTTVSTHLELNLAIHPTPHRCRVSFMSVLVLPWKLLETRKTGGVPSTPLACSWQCLFRESAPQLSSQAIHISKFPPSTPGK